MSMYQLTFYLVEEYDLIIFVSGKFEKQFEKQNNN